MILGIDTATETGVLGLYREDTGILAEVSFTLNKGHARFINPFLDKLFCLAGQDPCDIKGVAVGTGPGSFTGIRVGITVAKTLGTVLGIPLWGLSSLGNLAANIHPSVKEPVLALMDARNNRVYWGLCGEGMDNEGVDNLTELAQIINGYGFTADRVFCVGEVPPEYVKGLQEHLHRQRVIYRPSSPYNQIRGGVVAWRGWEEQKQNPRGHNLQKLHPRYMKGPVGQEEKR